MIESFEIPLGQRQLFFDFESLESRENLNHTLHQPEKKGYTPKFENAKSAEDIREA